MRVKGYSVAAALGFVAMVLAPQAAHAQVALGGTEWEADPDCIFDFVSFYADGTAKIVSFYSSDNPNDPDEGRETKLQATWALDGAKLGVKIPEFPNESLLGTVDDAGIHVTYNWQDNDNHDHADTCLLTRSAN